MTVTGVNRGSGRLVPMPGRCQPPIGKSDRGAELVHGAGAGACSPARSPGRPASLARQDARPPCRCKQGAR